MRVSPSCLAALDLLNFAAFKACSIIARSTDCSSPLGAAAGDAGDATGDAADTGDASEAGSEDEGLDVGAGGVRYDVQEVQQRAGVTLHAAGDVADEDEGAGLGCWLVPECIPHSHERLRTA